MCVLILIEHLHLYSVFLIASLLMRWYQGMCFQCKSAVLQKANTQAETVQWSPLTQNTHYAMQNRWWHILTGPLCKIQIFCRIYRPLTLKSVPIQRHRCLQRPTLLCQTKSRSDFKEVKRFLQQKKGEVRMRKSQRHHVQYSFYITVRAYAFK